MASENELLTVAIEIKSELPATAISIMKYGLHASRPRTRAPQQHAPDSDH